MDRQEALLRGDISNAVVDRQFVYSFQALGMHLCSHPDESPAMVRLQARYCQQALESLVEISETGNQRLMAQGLLLFVYSLVVLGLPSTAQLYLYKTCGVINKGDLRFLPMYGRPPELSEQVREDAAVLSQAIYLENYFYLTLGGPVPAMTARIEREFRLEFQVRLIRFFSLWGSEWT